MAGIGFEHALLMPPLTSSYSSSSLQSTGSDAAGFILDDLFDLDKSKNHLLLSLKSLAFYSFTHPWKLYIANLDLFMVLNDQGPFIVVIDTPHTDTWNVLILCKFGIKTYTLSCADLQDADLLNLKTQVLHTCFQRLFAGMEVDAEKFVESLRKFEFSRDLKSMVKKLVSRKVRFVRISNQLPQRNLAAHLDLNEHDSIMKT